MQEHFYESQLLEREQLKELTKKSNQPALLRFTLLILTFVVFAVASFITWGLASKLLLVFSLLGFGIVGCSAFACLHEAGHNTAFKSDRLNTIAAFVAGMMHFYPPAFFKEFHFTHHRYTNVPGKDPEISFGGKPVPSVVTTISSYLGWLSGLPLLVFKLLFVLVGALGMPEPLRRLLYPFIRPAVRWQLLWESWVLVLIYGGVIVAAIYADPRFWSLIVGQVVSHCILAVYLTPEHNGLPYEGSILEKTRSLNTIELVRKIMWNMPYHAEHHAFPGVPFHQLPELHVSIKNELKEKEDGYAQFHKTVVQGKYR